MKITLSNNRTLFVNIKHNVYDLYKKYKAVTTATIYENHQILGSGSTKCSSKDNFVRSRGASIALSRALAKVDLTKSERAEVYKKVFSQDSRPTISKNVSFIVLNEDHSNFEGSYGYINLNDAIAFAKSSGHRCVIVRQTLENREICVVKGM